jgi:predicted ABC-type ATPase
MFAGPNGSGKSTLKRVLPPKLLGAYLNPDEIERELRANGRLDLAAYGVTLVTDEVQQFLRKSKLLINAGLAGVSEIAKVGEGHLTIDPDATNSYVASVVTDLLRQHLLAKRATFTLETVMSHPSKVDLLRQARETGYRTYLYFIATEDPTINISRVDARVKRGGHPVPEDRIVKRYHASLELLVDAIRSTNRAYIFDNSEEGQAHTWLAEVTGGRELEMKTSLMPAWFKLAVWNKIANVDGNEHNQKPKQV